MVSVVVFRFAEVIRNVHGVFVPQQNVINA